MDRVPASARPRPATGPVLGGARRSGALRSARRVRGVRLLAAALLGVAALLFAAEWTPVRVAGESMRPALRSGQWLRLRHLPALRARFGGSAGSALRRGDLVVLRAPPGAAGRGRFVKRLVALPGERVALRGGVLFVNGRARPEPYVRHDGPVHDDFPEVEVLDGRIVALEGHPLAALPARLAGVPARLEPLPPEVIARSRREPVRHVASLALGPDEAFVLGDDRTPGASEDSRAFGPLPLRRIVGVATPLPAGAEEKGRRDQSSVLAPSLARTTYTAGSWPVASR